MSQQGLPVNRRDFLVSSAAALTLPHFVPAKALGLQGRPAPSERLTIGVIGTGGRGVGLINMFLNEKDVEIVALCDVDARHLQNGVQAVRKRTGKDCAAYKDFRPLLDRKDIDAVVVATPDHWHGWISIAAAKAGKDIYCEKPLVNSIAEGRALCQAVQEHKRVLQTGSHERSTPSIRLACELVRNGLIGKVHTVRINLPCSDNHHQKARAFKTIPPEEPVPEGFDYDFWLGPAPKAPYTPLRTHFWWRFILAYGGGEMTDRGAHVIDIAQLGLGKDDSGPIEIEAKGVQTPGSLYDAFWDYEFTNVYADGVRLIGSTATPRGLKFEGTEGWIFIHIHGGKLEAEPADLLKTDAAKLKVSLGRSPGHVRNFLDAVKTRQQPIAPAEVGHRTATICHLNNLAMRLGRKIRWDPMTERANDPEVNKHLQPPMRPPWTL
ncbi:MAG: Gfo/Idh/MocA family oxidoreductase [Gemmatales bacterium]|nr:Gfo/Idh/MocA family oxidoreductase [Gemmatales bacterium]MDW8174250.1 Gfo/Idh/MocA family oxidoreductase [Gemmatales bacterium]